MLAAIAEYERNNIAENVKMGMLARAKEGKWNGGHVLGYDVVEIEGANKNAKIQGLSSMNEKQVLYEKSSIFTQQGMVISRLPTKSIKLAIVQN